jgi:hypothetical protein
MDHAPADGSEATSHLPDRKYEHDYRDRQSLTFFRRMEYKQP